MKNCKGYSIVVLVITISIILIIASTAISTLINSREEREIAKFIYDVTNLRDLCNSYYAEKEILPVGNSISTGNISFSA